MILTIVLSGPRASEQQARTALASAGFTVDPDGHDHGLSKHPQGKKPRHAVAFLTVEHDDVDAVAECARPLNYMLRMHHEKPPTPELGFEQRLMEELQSITARLDALEARG